MRNQCWAVYRNTFSNSWVASAPEFDDGTAYFNTWAEAFAYAFKMSHV